MLWLTSPLNWKACRTYQQNESKSQPRTNLVDLHVARLKVALGRYSQLLLDLRLVEVRLDPSHLFVTERTVGFLVSITLLSDVVRVSAGSLDRSGNSPAGESRSHTAESIRSADVRGQSTSGYEGRGSTNEL